jgi:hypothetical protein
MTKGGNDTFSPSCDISNSTRNVSKTKKEIKHNISLKYEHIECGEKAWISTATCVLTMNKKPFSTIKIKL